MIRLHHDSGIPNDLKSLSDFNNSVMTSDSIRSGREHRRARRKFKRK